MIKPDAYRTAPWPTLDEPGNKRYVHGQFLAIQRSGLSLQKAVVELQEISGGLRLVDAEPGVYPNATLTIDENGRITAIQAGGEGVTVPAPSRDGTVLTASGGLAVWAPAPSPFPTGGSPGQVLTRTGTGQSWSDPVAADSGVTSVTVTAGNGIEVNGSPITSSGEIVVGLKAIAAPTVVEPKVSRLTVDEYGRITGVVPDTTPATDVGFAEEVSLGSFPFWRVRDNSPSFTDFEFAGVEFATSYHGAALPGVEMQEAGWVGRSFSNNVAVTDVRVTANAAFGVSTLVLEYSETGQQWTTALEYPDLADWPAGETRELSARPVPPMITVTGDVTALGRTSLVTTLSATGVQPGTYTSANVTVDYQGRITSIMDGPRIPTGIVLTEEGEPLLDEESGEALTDGGTQISTLPNGGAIEGDDMFIIARPISNGANTANTANTISNGATATFMVTASSLLAQTVRHEDGLWWLPVVESPVGNAGRMIVLNETEDGFVFEDVPDDGP